ncbi:uncharacterized protein C5L36_0A07390 [Pichia kudriavzevii]
MLGRAPPWDDVSIILLFAQIYNLRVFLFRRREIYTLVYQKPLIHLVMTQLNSANTVVFYAPTQELYDATKQFYINLGFSHREDSPKGCSLTNDSSITLLLDPEHAASAEQIQNNIANLLSHINRRDWRTLQSAISLETDALPELIQHFKDKNLHFQTRPNELEPVESYVVDPLGSIVGFTALHNPLATNLKSRSIKLKSTTTSGSLATTASSVDLRQRPMSTHQRNIAVMTSGGDAPGMNANVRAIIRTAIARGHRAFAIHEGYSGLVKGGEYIKEMKWTDVNGWLVQGGTNIGTARCMEFKERWGRLKGCKNMIEAGIDALIVCGGDGSLTGADRFREEWPSLIQELLEKKEITQQQYDTYKHLNICGTVGSIDNDMSSTDSTIGAYSSLDRICQAIDYIDATANSHQRAFVIEVMGRHCGWLGLMASIATSADYMFIPEEPSSRENWADKMCEIISAHRTRGKRKTIVIVAEGAICTDLSPITCNDVKDVLVEKLGLDTRVTTLGHVQRGGPAVAFDRVLATLQGVAAVDAVLESTPSTPSQMIGIAENKIVKRSLVEAVKLTKSVAAAIEAKDFDKAMSLRDTEFSEHLKYYKSINTADFREPSLPVEKRKKFAIINVGAPAGGMNSATYAFANFCLSRGHIPYAIYNGFSGLARHESIKKIDWLNIDGWNALGGSEIGTNRTTPIESDLGLISYYFSKYELDGLVVVGGFEALESIQELESARSNYPAFRIPMVLIPATISNNVPGTEYSLGSDTCLNKLVEYCDVITQSASSTRDRCFVVECQGGNSGYIATYAQLCSGAEASYVPEEQISLKQLRTDIESLKTTFHLNKGKKNSGLVVIKSANASKALSTETIGEIIADESDGLFDSRTAIPGHVQQGGIPSPIDRCRATRFAIKAVEFLEDKQEIALASSNEIGEFVNSDEVTNTCSVLGVDKSHIKFRSVREVWNVDTHKGKRMRKTVFWQDVRGIADMLVGRVKV